MSTLAIVNLGSICNSRLEKININTQATLAKVDTGYTCNS